MGVTVGFRIAFRLSGPNALEVLSYPYRIVDMTCSTVFHVDAIFICFVLWVVKP